uniref:Uncharacterized protein n=1 Tax=Amphimedon queenslandica TaxID=400682 RepID=A0A1X7U9G3_AMPQE
MEPMYFTDYVEIGQIESDGEMAMKFNNKCVSLISHSFKVVWVGVLLKNGLVHTGAGIHGDIKVTFKNGATKTYQYMVMHIATATEDMKLKICFSFGDYYYDIYHGLADAYHTKFITNLELNTGEKKSFIPVVAGETWKSDRFTVCNVIQKMGHFFEVEGHLSLDFSISMYYYFAGKGKETWKDVVDQFSGKIYSKDYASLYSLKEKLDSIKET